MCDNRSDRIINYKITPFRPYLNLKTKKFIYWNLPRLNGGGYIQLYTLHCSMFRNFPLFYSRFKRFKAQINAAPHALTIVYKDHNYKTTLL